MSRIGASVILLFALGILGCRSVRPSELTGTWVINESSRSLLPTESQAAAATLVLNASGTFVASGLPEDLPLIPPYDVNQQKIRLDSGRGYWKLIPVDNEERLQLVFQSMEGNKDVPYGTELFISRGWSSVSLFSFLGDPDEGRRISFEKR